MRTIMIVAGGTGGHIFPGLALADHLLSEGWQVCWVSGTKWLEKQLISREARIRHECISFSGVRGQSWQRALSLPWRLIAALLHSRRLLKQYRPDIVVGFGGYITVPVGLMAWLSRIPLCIHEQNARAGLANRVLYPLSSAVFTGFSIPSWSSARYVGNPVRAILRHLPAPHVRFAEHTGPLQVLIMGGSLGAQIFNQLFPEVLAALPPDHRPIVYHQTGQESLSSVAERYAHSGISATVRPFFEDMAEVYSVVDFVFCRAGALSMAELSCVGLGALCIPYPFAVDDHQYHNAMVLHAVGAVELWRQTNLTHEQLYDFCLRLSRERCAAYAQRAYQVLPQDAVDKMAAYCADCAGYSSTE